MGLDVGEPEVGAGVGETVDGLASGATVGDSDGDVVGEIVGATVGEIVGAGVTQTHAPLASHVLPGSTHASLTHGVPADAAGV